MASKIKFRGIFLIPLLLVGCTTTSFKEYERGDLVASHLKVKQKPLAPEYKIAATYDGSRNLNVQVTKDDMVEESWINSYKKLAVYEEKCRPTGTTGSFRFYDENCDFDLASFAVLHVLIVGFIMDPLIPAFNYGNSVDFTEPTSGRFEESASTPKVVRTETVQSGNLSLSINGHAFPTSISNGAAQWNLAALVKASKIENTAVTASIAFTAVDGNATADVSEQAQVAYNELQKIKLAQEEIANKKEEEAKRQQARLANAKATRTLASIDAKLKSQKCLNLHFSVIQRVDPHVYTINFPAYELENDNAYGGEVFALLVTNKTKFSSLNGIADLGVKYSGHQQITTAGGSVEDRDVYTESSQCSDLVKSRYKAQADLTNSQWAH